jgi:hypothetical protein
LLWLPALTRLDLSSININLSFKIYHDLLVFISFAFSFFFFLNKCKYANANAAVRRRPVSYAASKFGGGWVLGNVQGIHSLFVLTPSIGHGRRSRCTTVVQLGGELLEVAEALVYACPSLCDAALPISLGRGQVQLQCSELLLELRDVDCAAHTSFRVAAAAAAAQPAAAGATAPVAGGAAAAPEPEAAGGRPGTAAAAAAAHAAHAAHAATAAATTAAAATAAVVSLWQRLYYQDGTFRYRA